MVSIKLSIITLNYNKPQLTLACISSIHKQYREELKKGTIEIIIVDNASSDDSVKQIKSAIKKHAYASTYLLENIKNAGFGAGNNFGEKKAKGEYLLFLNNDTTVMDRSFLDMAAFMDSRPHVAILGGQVRNIDGSFQASVGSFYSLIKIFLLLLGLQRYGFLDKNPQKIAKVDWVKGALLLIRKNVFEKLQGFDEKIFMYTEDMELCFRAHKAGYLTYFYPYSMVLHEEHGSTNRTFAIVHIYGGLLYFYRKHKNAWQVWVLQCILKSKAIVLIVIGKLLKKEYFISTYEQALNVVR